MESSIHVTENSQISCNNGHRDEGTEVVIEDQQQMPSMQNNVTQRRQTPVDGRCEDQETGLKEEEPQLTTINSKISENKQLSDDNDIEKQGNQPQITDMKNGSTVNRETHDENDHEKQVDQPQITDTKNGSTANRETHDNNNNEDQVNQPQNTAQDASPAVDTTKVDGDDCGSHEIQMTPMESSFTKDHQTQDGSDLNDQETEVVIIGSSNIGEMSHADLLKLAEEYLKNGNRDEVKYCLSEALTRLDGELSKNKDEDVDQQCKQTALDILPQWLTTFYRFHGNHTAIVLFMSFGVASHVVQYLKSTSIPSHSKQKLFSLLQLSWIICARCHFILREYGQTLDVLKLICNDPRQCTNCEVLELSALCFYYTKQYSKATDKVELCLKFSKSDEQKSRLRKLYDELHTNKGATGSLNDGKSETGKGFGYSYGDHINLVESIDIDVSMVNDLTDNLSPTASITESEYSSFSEASAFDDSKSSSGFSQRSRKRKVRRKTRSVRLKKGIYSDSSDSKSSPTSLQSLQLQELDKETSSKFEDIKQWRAQASNYRPRNRSYASDIGSNRQNLSEELLYSRVQNRDDNMSDTSSVTSRRNRDDIMSDTSSVTSHVTMSQRELSQDEFSDSEYDISDSGGSWYGSDSDNEVREFPSNQNVDEEPTYYERSTQYHSGQFSARNILEKEYFQKGLDLSDDCIEELGRHYFKGKRVVYNDIRNKNFDDQCLKLPKMFKKCTISIESAHFAVCTPLEPNDEIQEIEILGRSKCGQTFSDDTVIVKIFKPRSFQENTGKVHGEIVSLEERHRYKDIQHPVFVCLKDLKEGHLMKPLCRTVPKLHVLHSKVQRNHKHLRKSRVEIYTYDSMNGKLNFSRYHDVEEGEREQWLFIVAFIKWVPNKIYPLAAVIDVIHCTQNPYDGIRIKSKEYQVPYFYKKSTVDGVLETFEEVKTFTTSGYIDRTGMRVFTIDPPGSKDLDDALSIRQHKDGYIVGVHIADVASVIKKNSPIDLEAQERCVTFYPGKGFRPFAMLPEPLSESVLSLRPKQVRPAISIFFMFDSKGKLSKQIPNVEKSIIKSCRQFTYQEVQDILDEKESNEYEEDLISDIKMLHNLSEKLQQNGIKMASMSVPIEIDLNEEENPMETYQAHSLVSEFMILANHSIAKLLRKKFPGTIPLLCQQRPPEEIVTKWYDLNKHYIHHILGLQEKNVLMDTTISVFNSPPDGRSRKFTPIQSWIVEEIRNLIPGLENEENIAKIKQLILSDYLHPKQALAFHEWNLLQESSRYICSFDIMKDQERCNHFSLGKNPYVHFTSPIRRYCDIIIHRLVTAMLNGEQSPYTIKEITGLCVTMNDATKRSNNFKKDCNQFILARYLRENPILFNGFVKELSDNGIKVVIPGLQKLPAVRKEIKFNLVDVASKPQLDDDIDMLGMTKHEKKRKRVVVKWEKRLYSYLHQVCKKPRPSRFAQERTNFSHYLRIFPHQNTTFLRYKDHWEKMIKYIIEDDTAQLKDFLLRFNEDRVKLDIVYDTENISSKNRSVKDVSSEVYKGLIVEHRCKFQVPFHHGQVVQVQMSGQVNRGFLTPVPQVLDVTNNVKFCIDHYDNPIKTLMQFAKLHAKSSYSDVRDYIATWIPIIEMESAVSAVHEDSAVINDLPIEFRGRRGRFVLTKGFCDVRDLNLGSRDIDKITSQITDQEQNTQEDLSSDQIEDQEEQVEETNTAEESDHEESLKTEETEQKDIVKTEETDVEDKQSNMSRKSDNSSVKKKPKYTDILSSHFLCIRLKCPLPLAVKQKVGGCLPKYSHYIWVAHGKFIKCRTVKTKKYSERRGEYKKVMEIDLVFKLHKDSPPPPVEIVKPEDKCSVELIFKAKVYRRIEVYVKLLGFSSELAIDIALGRSIRPCDPEHLVITRSMDYEIDVPGFPQNNNQQHIAIRKALNSRFSLIQGPPGTGKTFTGVKLVYLFNKLNQLRQNEDGHRRRIVFCGPSNKSVDLVARWVINKLGDKAPRIVRMYASAYEYLDYPVPGCTIISSRNMRDAKTDVELKGKGVILHHIIRQQGKPHADDLLEFDQKFEVDNAIIRENETLPHEQRKPVSTTLEQINAYKKLLAEATLEELDNYDVIFCTTSMSANPKLLEATKNHVSQVIIDECGMCTEPESMVPIIATQAKQVVLIGDHKQLRPIIMCREAADLGLDKSLFERYSSERGLMTMLEEQYRMHSSICEFPSKAFYGNKLKTAVGTSTGHTPLRMWPRKTDGHIPRVFCHVEGEEEALTVRTKEGNEQSRSNQKEIEQVLKVFKHMVEIEHVDPLSINVMSQYNAQCTALRAKLTENGYEHFNVTTVVSSQGGEWNYVIFSLVRSLPKYLIEKNPTEGWCIQNLGFITDKHQINVALTRAKKGLVIIGNKNLLECDEVWKKLLEDYQERDCVFDARNFPNRRASRVSAENPS